MPQRIDKDTRFYLDLDLKTGQVIRWKYGQREKLKNYRPKSPFHHRVFLSQGQYNKLVMKNSALIK